MQNTNSMVSRCCFYVDENSYHSALFLRGDSQSYSLKKIRFLPTYLPYLEILFQFDLSCKKKNVIHPVDVFSHISFFFAVLQLYISPHKNK